MRRWTNHVFSLIIALIMISGCSRSVVPPASTQERIDAATLSSPFTSVTSGMSFDTRIHFSRNKMSGLMHLRQVDRGHWRIAFTTKVGQTLFDFEILQDTFMIRRCVDQMRRQVVLDHLERDLRLVTGEYGRVSRIEQVKSVSGTLHKRFKVEGSKGWWHHVTDMDGQVEKIAWGKRSKSKTTVVFQAFHEGLPGKVRIDHKTIVNFEIEMEFIPVQH